MKQTHNHIVRRTTVMAAALASLITGLLTGTPASAAPADGDDRPDPQPATLPAPADYGPAEPHGPSPSPSSSVPVTPPLPEPDPADPADPSAPADSTAPVGPADSAVPAEPLKSGIRIFQGEGFDTCIAPSYATMRAWRASPYRAVGVYIGGRGRACPNQPNLDRKWVRDVSNLGWRLLPLYVGSQSPCVHSPRKRPYAIAAANPWRQGVREGRDAVAQARKLGMAGHSAIYLDMEAYDRRNTRCARTTLTFVRGWNREVRRLGYTPGFYSSATSGVTHLQKARSAGKRDLPAAIWFARWRVGPNVHSEPALASGAWQPHRRIHQYEGNVKQRFGGRTLKIDKNLVDAPVAIVK